MPNNTQPTTHDAEANYLGNDIAEKQGGDVEFLRKRLLEYQLKIKTQDQLLEAFRTSTSWRITAPPFALLVSEWQELYALLN